MPRLSSTSVRRSPAWLAVAFVGALVPPAAAADPPREGVEFFEKHIRPVLTEKCYSCHSAAADKVRGGLLLDSRDGLLKGGDNGPAVVPGQPDKSRLIAAIRHAGDAKPMPPKEKLADDIAARFVEWVKMGAPDPRTAAAPAPPSSIDFAKARLFWSFQPVCNSALPQLRTPHADIRNPIDRFLLAKLEEKGLRPAGPADRRTLIRRATFDLTGLPPTPEEVEAFVHDPAPDAYEKLIDRLLASPAYGERWGRHWLDLVRYADTSGCNSDYPIPAAHKYRDYVIRAFNDDKPYDRFLREQIAGDLLPAATEAQRREQVIATGYLATARRFGSLANEFHLTLEDVIDNLGKSVLGLSLGCARCHDHKFDPVPTADYYALYGIFNSTAFAFPGTEIYQHPKDFTALDPADAERLLRVEKELADLDNRHETLMTEKRKLDALKAAGKESENGMRTVKDVEADQAKVKEQQREVEKQLPPIPKAYAVHEGRPANARVQQKGDPKALGDEAPRGFLHILGGQKLPPDEKGSGRRELADWLTDSHNPLTARVMVNRIWQHHFGRGIVATPNDFGARGEPPTHPELLDWLATEFMASGGGHAPGWSIKKMHRLIMISAAYQMAGSDDARAATIDPANAYLWHFPRRRLSAEEIRDTLLAVSGDLDRTPGGAHPFPPEGTYRYTQHAQFVAVYPSRHRSVYLMQQRIKKHPFLEVFDGADPNAPTAVRPFTTTPLQALFLMNDPFAHERADAWAKRLEAVSADDAARIDRAYREAFARPAAPHEVGLGEQYLAECRAALAEAGVAPEQRGHAAWASYARVLMSSNEFVFVD